MALNTAIKALAHQIGSDIKALREQVASVLSFTGSVDQLTTTAKTLTGAIEEVKASTQAVAGGVVSQDALNNSVNTAITNAIGDEVDFVKVYQDAVQEPQDH